MSVSIQPFQLEDYEAVVAFWKQQDGVGLNESDSREAIQLFLERNRGMSFVVREGASVIGAALCGTDGRRGYLHHVAIAKEHRGRGWGRKLVEACLGELKTCGISRCNIFLFADNVEGEAFWKKIGYRVRADLKVMQRPLQ